MYEWNVSVCSPACARPGNASTARQARSTTRCTKTSLAAGRIAGVSVVWIALLACAVIVLIAAEWPRLDRWVGVEARRGRDRKRRKANLKVVRTDESLEEFAASVERDLSKLPTIDERD